jgi:serine/threonine protein kinase
MDLAAQQIPPGGQIGPYQVERKLGAGGMGEVYLARHRHLNRDAAIKVLLAEISMNQTVVSRFFTEARATAQLRHPHIVEIFDCDVLPDGRAYIVMEYLRGESLRGTLDRVGTLSPDWNTIAAISGMVANALAAAHENGIVHRDLKPDNTYLSTSTHPREGLTIKILDFGIAKLLAGSDRVGGGSTPTRTGSLIGTPLYMSPEQCRGIATIDHRADIYSLGCMMFEMVVGQPPFVAEAPGDILMAHILQNAPSIRSFRADVPAEIDALVARMLAKDPAMRPQSMAEVVAIVETLLGVRKADLATMLRKPAGFPEPVGQAATQILPIAEAPSRSTPAPGKTPSRPQLTPTSAMTPPPTSTPIRAKVTPAPNRPQRPTSTPMSSDEVPSLAPTRPKWLLPVAIIAAVVAVGGVTAYFLSKPHATTAATTEPEPVKKAEPTTEEPLGAGAFVPPPSQEQERAKELNVQPREIEPKEVREPEKVPARAARPDRVDKVDKGDRSPTSNAAKKKTGAKPVGKAAGSGFKAVGD